MVMRLNACLVVVLTFSPFWSFGVLGVNLTWDYGDKWVLTAWYCELW